MPFETTGKETADNFTKEGGATPGFVKNTAAGDWEFGQSGSGYTFVETIDVLSDTTSVSFTGLNGDSDRAYRIMYDIGPIAKAPLDLFLRPNGLSTNQSSMRWQLSRLGGTFNVSQNAGGMLLSDVTTLVPVTVTQPSDLGTVRQDMQEEFGILLKPTDSANYVSGQDLSVGELVTGQTSGATGVVATWTAAAIGSPGSAVELSNVTGNFQAGEVALGGTSGFQITITAGTENTVSSWEDNNSPGIGFPFWIPTATNRQPTRIFNGTPIGTLSSISFDGVDDNLRNGAGAGGFSSRTFTSFYVVRLPQPGGANDEIIGYMNNNFSSPAFTFKKVGGQDVLRVQRQGGGGGQIFATDGNGFSLGQWAVVSFVGNGSRMWMRINGVSQGFTTTNSSGQGWSFSGFQFADQTPVSTPGAVEYGAYISYNATKTDAEIAGMEQFLGAKYGITLASTTFPFVSGWLDFYAETGANRLLQGYDTFYAPNETDPLRQNDISAHWTDTTTNVTSLMIEASVANGIPAGSKFGLYKIDKTP